MNDFLGHAWTKSCVPVLHRRSQQSWKIIWPLCKKSENPLIEMRIKNGRIGCHGDPYVNIQRVEEAQSQTVPVHDLLHLLLEYGALEGQQELKKLGILFVKRDQSEGSWRVIRVGLRLEILVIFA